jgi:small-conductance mechanosensitive channel
MVAVALATLVAVITIGCILSVAPALAQAKDTPTAPIILDGRRLFVVSQSGRYNAEERADDANRVLKQKIETANSPLPVKIEESQSLPIIKVDGAHLLTVTQEDAPAGRTAKEQAEIWAGRLDQAIKEAQEQRSPAYLRKALVFSVGSVLLAIACSWILGWIWRRWLQPMLPQEMRDSEDNRPRFSVALGVRISLAAIRLALFIGTALYVTNLFPQTRELSSQITSTIVSSLVSKLIPLGNSSYSVLDLFILVGLFTGVLFLAGTVKKVLRSRVLRLTGLSRGSQETVAQIATYGMIFLGTIVVLQLWGLDLSSLTILASVIGVGIGLGLQGIAKEFISGLVIIFERPIRVGDFVNVGELMGTVERISVRSTEIRTLDEVSIIIPNSRFLEGEVVNWTHHSPVSRLKLPISVAYGSNLTTVRAALIDAAKEYPDVLAEPTPRVFFKGFGSNSLDFDLLIWIAEPRKQFQIKSDLYYRIEAILRHRHIEIPFPQQDLHIRSGSLPLEVSPQLAESLAQLSNGLAKWLERQSTAASQDSPHKSTADNGQYRNS